MGGRRTGGLRMRRYFNTEGWCSPDRHYMVRLDERLDKIKRLYVDREKYFIINRGRQYGKTTTLYALEEYLKADYLVISLDFQGISTMEYSDEHIFTKAFLRMFVEVLEDSGADTDEVRPVIMLMREAVQTTLGEMFYLLSKFCKAAAKPVVMMIDEVDNAGNHQVFIDFLALLRSYYLKRKNKTIFHSVILAGVYDIKNLKLKIRPDAEHQYNSPWNIAADFDIKMNFSADQIRAMLEEYEEDNRTGMDVRAMAEEIYQYTSGYPYLVSALCKILDEKLPEELPEELPERLPEKTQERLPEELQERLSERISESLQGDQPGELPEDGTVKARKIVWSGEGLAEAVKILLNEKSPLFDSMMKQLDTYKELRGLIEEIVYQGKKVPFSPDTKAVNMGLMFGFLKEQNGRLAVANRIFEMRIINLFITEESLKSDAFRSGDRDRNQFIRNGRLDMRLVLEKFVEYFHDVYGENDEKFVESYGRKFFLLYLKPIINGTGNYYLEAQTRDMGRTDVVVDYRGEQFVVEMKIWRGNEYNERGERQLLEYLDYFRRKKGYMLSFNFNKKKEIGVKEIAIGDKTIVEAVV